MTGKLFMARDTRSIRLECEVSRQSCELASHWSVTAIDGVAFAVVLVHPFPVPWPRVVPAVW